MMIAIALAIAVIGYFVFGSFTLYLDIQVLFAVILFFGVFLSGKLIQMHMDAKEFYRKMGQRWPEMHEHSENPSNDAETGKEP